MWCLKMMSDAVSRLAHIYDGGEQKWAQHARRDRWEYCGVALTPELTARHKDLYKKRGSRTLHAFLTEATTPIRKLSLPMGFALNAGRS